VRKRQVHSQLPGLYVVHSVQLDVSPTLALPFELTVGVDHLRTVAELDGDMRPVGKHPRKRHPGCEDDAAVLHLLLHTRKLLSHQRPDCLHDGELRSTQQLKVVQIGLYR
jgi:hypothetical protein